MEESAGIREVKKSLSRYIRKVKMGQTITITDRGVPVAKLSPVPQSIPEEIITILESGLASWKGSKPGQFRPVSKNTTKGKSLSAMISEDRR